MIYTNATIFIYSDYSVVSNPVLLHRGDKNVKITFQIQQKNFKFYQDENSVLTTEANYGQLVIEKPNGLPLFSDIVEFDNNKIEFTITKNMIDELSEVGFYNIQIRLYDKEKTARVTMPKALKALEIKEPVSVIDPGELNEISSAINEAMINFSVVQEGELIADIDYFDKDGNYIKTTWNDGDIITQERMNKIEGALSAINNKVENGADNVNIDLSSYAKKADIPTKISQLTNDSNYATTTYVNSAISNAQLGGDVDLSEYATKSELNQKANKSEVPTKISQLTNDANYATQTYVQNQIANAPTIGTSSVIDYDLNVKAVNHRGYSKGAPENTIPAYIMSKQKGFTYVECDVSFTKDSVAVLLHDSTIDRTSNGSGNIQSLTYEQLLQYDFGSWYSSKFAGTKIPTFKEFMMYCKGLGLHPYIELKSSGGYTESQIRQVVDEVELCGMKGKVTYISFSATFLEYVKAYDEEARLGYIADITSSTINTANNLKNGKNEVFMDVNYTYIKDSKVALCMENDLPIEVWTVNDSNVIKKLNPYISGVTSDNQIAGKILYDLYSTYTNTEYISATSITLNKTSLTFEELKTQTLTATVAPSNASGSVVWKSSNTSIATVSNGVVTPLKDGSCTITASIDSVNASCNITVATAAKAYTITKNLNGCTSSNTAANVIEGEAYIDTFTSTLGYTLEGATVSITMGGADVSGYYNNGALNIPSVTGDIVINIVAKEKEIVKYSITRNLTNCTSSSSITEIIEAESHTETFTPSIEYSLLSSNMSITMGGVDITSYYNNRVLNIPSVTGDIVINIEGAKLTSPLIDYTFSSGGTHGVLTNTGTGGATYDIQTVGTYNVVDDKLSLLNGAYASVDYPTTTNGIFTIHIKGSYDSLIGNQYERMFRSDTDALCGYYVRDRKNFGIKLSNNKGNGGVLHDTSVAEWYPDNSNTLNMKYNAVGLGIMHDYVYTADGTTIKFYFDGKLVASQNQSALKVGTSFALGNIQNTANTYNANITVEKWKIFDYAMNSEEVYELVNLKGIEKYTITRNLNGCTSSSDITKILGLQAHTETFTANEGYKMEGAKVSVTMGGVDISDCYADGTLTINSVTGNIFISIEAIDSSWEVVRTLTQDDLQLIQLNKNAPSYTNSGSTRVSYPAFDLFFDKGYMYKFDVQVAEPGKQYNIGVQCYTEADYANVGKSASLQNVYDPGWQSLDVEMTPPSSYNGSPIKGYRITFRNTSNSNMKATDIVSVTIMRKQINYTNIIKTINSSDLVFGNLKTTKQSTTGGYYVTDNTRLSYVDFDIPMTTGKTYKFVYTSSVPLKIGVQSHTIANVDSINSGGTPTLSVTDYKWHDNEYECTMLVANTGGCRITFCNANNSSATLAGNEIEQVTIYEY